jgi:hypothetical protein
MGYEAEQFKHCKVIDPKTNTEGKDSGNPLVESIYCLNWFSGGVFRIRGHILGTQVEEGECVDRRLKVLRTISRQLKARVYGSKAGFSCRMRVAQPDFPARV